MRSDHGEMKRYTTAWTQLTKLPANDPEFCELITFDQFMDKVLPNLNPQSFRRNREHFREVLQARVLRKYLRELDADSP